MSIGGRSAKPSMESVDGAEYYESFRRKVFKLVRMGYDRLDAMRFKDSEEPDITGELVKHIQEVIEDPATPNWVVHFFVRDDPPVNVPGRLGKRRPRVDIEFEVTRRGPRPRYPFEAKRLSRRSFGVKKYVGEGGLQDFLCGKYAAKQPEAGMLGYVQTDSQAEWAERIAEEFKRGISTLQICPGGDWCVAEDIGKVAHCYRSKHNRPPIGKPITLYHCLLAFCEPC